MDIKEMIARAQRTISALIQRYNAATVGLNDLRAAETPDDAAIAAARERQTGIATELEAARAELDALEIEREQIEAVERLQARTTPTEPVSDTAPTRTQTVSVNERENPVYRRGGEHSYFRDLYGSSTGAPDSIRRLAESQVRAGSSAAGSGGEFSPPAYLVDDFVELARAARVTADLMLGEPLPDGAGGISLPKITGNTTPAVQVTQNTTITEGAFTTTSVTSGIAEITGKQTVPIALLRQSPVPIDRVIIGDLAAAYAASLDLEVINGDGSAGHLRGLITAGTTVTYTTTQPTQASTSTTNSFYSKVLGAQAALVSVRFLPADALLMHTRRWLWILNGYDGNGRPLVPPSGNQENAPGVSGEPVAQGFAGYWGGQPVYVDPNIPINRGAATNQDVAFVLRRNDLWLWESDVEERVFDATLADQNSILFRVLGFAALIPDRHRASVQVIDGTGLVAPTF